MAISDEVAKLQELHQRGALTDDEFGRAKARLLNEGETAAPQAAAALNAVNAFRLSRNDRWIGGVCGGIARSSGMESWLIRLLFCVLLVCGGVGVLLYVLLWIFVPSE